MTYSITFRRRLTFLAKPLLILLFAFVISYLIIGWSSNLVIAPLLVFAGDTLPALILHFGYLINNLRAELVFDRNTKQIIYTKGAEQLRYKFGDIRKIIIMYIAIE